MAEDRVISCPSVELPYEDNNYVICNKATAGMMSGNDVPDWLNNAITDRMLSGTSDFRDILNDLGTVLDTLKEGVNQSIQTIKNDHEVSTNLLTTSVSKLNSSSAEMLSLISTKVTDEEARSSSLDVLRANFNNEASKSTSYVVQSMNTLSNDIGTQATRIDGLNSSFNVLGQSQSATATALNKMYTYAGVNSDGSLYTSSGYFRDLYTKIGNTEVKINTVEEVAITAKDWAANASKLITGPSGEVTGWSFGDGSNVHSTFVINADKFAIRDSSNMHTPFSIDATTGKSKFNGVVSFSNTDMSQYDNNNSQPIVGCKVNHTSFNTSSDGEVFICGYKDGVLSNTNGYTFIKGAKTVLPKTYINPNGVGVGYIVYDTSNNNYKAVKKVKGVWKTFANGNINTYNLYGIGTIENTANELVKSAEMWTYSAHLDTLPDPTDSLADKALVEANRRVLPSGVAHAINTNSTTINGSKITTGSIYASKIATGTLTARQIDVNSLFAQNITATGTITGATIRGGNIRGTSISADDITTGTLNTTHINSGDLTTLKSFNNSKSLKYNDDVYIYNISTDNADGSGTMVFVNIDWSGSQDIYSNKITIKYGASTVYTTTIEASGSKMIIKALPAGNSDIRVIFDATLDSTDAECEVSIDVSILEAKK